MFIKYFIQDGSFGNLQSYMLEEIETNRDRAITYKEETLEYQWGWRTVSATVKAPVEEYLRQKDLVYMGENVGI